MSSKSSDDPERIQIGRIAGHRGRQGELTARVAVGDAQRWCGVRRVWIAGPAVGADRPYEVEHARAYRDRLVLKLRGVDDGDGAARLRGGKLAVAAESAPALGPGEFYSARLVGLSVVDEKGGFLGRIADVVPTGGTDLLRVVTETEGEELLVPFAREHLLEVDLEGRRVRVCLPAGLRELNRAES